MKRHFELVFLRGVKSLSVTFLQHSDFIVINLSEIYYFRKNQLSASCRKGCKTALAKRILEPHDSIVGKFQLG